LEYLHRQDCGRLVHLDLKPDNIMIDGDNTVRIIDFDSSQKSGQERMYYYGSVGFAAPEQYHRLRMDCRADIYSLGMIIMYMDNGHIQSNAASLHHSQLYPIIKKCMHHHSSQRYADVSVLKRSLEKLMDCNEVCTPKQKNKNGNDTSHKIYVYGTRRGIGTTHLCLCISSFLAARGFSTVCVEKGDSFDLRSEAHKGILQENGTFLYKNIAILPNYQDKITADLTEFQFEVADCGINHVHKKSDNEVCIAVTEFGYRIKQEREAVQKLPRDSEIFVNHTAGKAFYEALKTMPQDKKYHRMPCVYNWWEENESLSDEFLDVFCAAFPDLNIKKKGGRFAGFLEIKKRISKFY
jgi:serine/threonine protein kinase